MSPAHAQNMFEWETTEQRMTAAQSVQALGSDLFGDNIGLQTGTLSFSVTDVDLPGNSPLPVRFTRTYEMNSTRGVTLNQMLADWSVQAPRLTGRFAPDWMVVDPDAPGVPVASNVRCSNNWLPFIPTGSESGPPGTFELSDFSQGVQVEIPGVASGELLRTASGVTRPDPSYLWTTDGQIHLKCIALEGDPTGPGPNAGEGFEAITPDGTKYTFNRMAQRAVPGLKETLYDTVTPPTYNLGVRENSLYATKVEDRFGNWVTYSYSNAWNQPARLTKILAKDGRQIDIAYQSDRVHTVTAVSQSDPKENRVWTYTYGTTAPGQPSLSGVDLPGNNSAWVINFATLSHSPIIYPTGGEVIRDCLGTLPVPINHEAQPIGTVKHPSGATASFKLGIRTHGRSNVTLTCANVVSPNNNTNDDNNIFGLSYNTWSLLEKVITGDGLVTVAGEPVTYTWLYEYDTSAAISFHRYPSTPPDLLYPVCNEAVDPCREPFCTAANAGSCTAGETKTLVTKPDGSKERYVFGTSWQYTEGKLLRVEREAIDTPTVIETETHDYDFSLSDAAYPARYGVSLRANLDGFDSEYHRPKLETITARDGIDFIWRIGNTCGAFRCFDYFARPTSIVKESTLDPSFSKTETQTYHDNLGKWVLGQLATTTVDDVGPDPPIVMSVTTYDSTLVRPLTQTVFGRMDRSFEWHAGDGNLWKSKDALNRAYVMTDYFLGVPRSVVLPTGATHEIKATVDAFGNVESLTNAMGQGFTTSYTYDEMNRVTSITYPTGDTVDWDQTTITFAQTNINEHNVPVGLWARTETTGTHVKKTWYDALWRPILERDSAPDGSPSTRFVRRVFDHNNRETFVSYPLDGLAGYITADFGVRTDYDALGRMESTEADSEFLNLPLVTEFDYGPGFITEQTDPRGKITTMTFQAWDRPTNEFPRQIQSPAAQITLITRDVFGKPTRMNRSGVYDGNPVSLTRDFIYDANQRLCKTVEPESGATIIEYDIVNDVEWTAIGQNLPGLTSCDRASVVPSHKSSHDYDALRRLTAINHPTGTEDVGFSYFADGALEKATSAGSEWTYTYNKRRLLESESLQFDSRTFALDWQYNTRGQLLALTYPNTPSGPLSINYNPSARGQPRNAGSFATVTNRHANGAIKNLTYGNALTLSTTQNERQLPQTRVVGTILNYTMGYDRNGNLTSVVDGAGGIESRTMDYDNVNRLILATAPNIYGIETFAYDPLDNLRHSQIGTVTFDYLLDSNGKNRLDQINIDGQPFLDYASNEQGDTTRRNRIPSDWIFANGFEESPSLRQAMLENTATTQELVYDRAHRLTGVGNTPGLADIEQYMYDAHGHRVATVRASDGLKRYQVYSKAGELLFTQDHRSNEIAEYVNLDGSLVARRTQPIPGGTLTVTYSHTDMRGTPVVETSAAGTPSPDRTILAPYGAPYSGVYREGPSFTGHATDATTGLSYMQQRYYDPIAARFLSVDPIAADAVSFGRYWYANNNPIKYIDPNGRKGELAMERFAEDVGRNPETYQYMVAPAAVVTGAALVATVGAVVASFAASNPAAANELGIAMMEALSGDALGPTSVAVAGMALNASADGVIKLFHQGRLVDGQVSSTRALSTSLSSDLNHYNPSGELNEFHVPSSTFDGWENSGLIEYRRDMHQPSGSVTEEILIMPPASGELNEYIQPR